MGEATRSPALTFRQSSRGLGSSPWCSWPLAFARRQLAGSLRRVPGAGLSGGADLAAGSRAGPEARGGGLARPPLVASFPRQRLPALGAFPGLTFCPRYSWPLRALTSRRSRPPYGRRRAKPALETVEKLVTALVT
jgi:hypothetical protein